MNPDERAGVIAPIVYVCDPVTPQALALSSGRMRHIKGTQSLADVLFTQVTTLNGSGDRKQDTSSIPPSRVSSLVVVFRSSATRTVDFTVDLCALCSVDVDVQEPVV